MRSAVLAYLLALVACSAKPEPIRVFTASSLTELAQAAAEAHQAATGEPVDVIPGGSHLLRVQLEQGAPGHLFLAAHPRHVEGLEGRGRVLRRARIGQHRLVVITPKDNPSGLRRWSDIVKAKRVVLGDSRAPIGTYTDAIMPPPPGLVSREGNVRLVRAKVALGEAEAAVVYASDVQGQKSLKVFAVPPKLQPEMPVEAALLDEAAAPLLAWLLGSEGQAMARRLGISP